MDADDSPGHDVVDVPNGENPISVADSVSEIRQLLEQFSARCDDEMLRLKDEFLSVRPRISRLTMGLATVVAGLTSVTGYLMITNGATTAQFLLSAIGEMFLFGLVIASGLTDLLWRDPTKILFAKNEQLAKIAGIQDDIGNLAAMRQEWERDVVWHRRQGGEAREALADVKLQLADAEALYEHRKAEILSMATQRAEAEALLQNAKQQAADASEKAGIAVTELEQLEANRNELDAQLASQSSALTKVESQLELAKTDLSETESRHEELSSASNNLRVTNEKADAKLKEKDLQRNNLEQEILEAVTRLADATNEALETENGLETLTAAAFARETELSGTRQQVEESRKVQLELETAIADQEETLASGRETLTYLQNEITRSEVQYEKIAEKIEAVESKCLLFEQKIAECESLATDKKTLLDSLELAREELQQKLGLAGEAISAQENAVIDAESKLAELIERSELEKCSAEEKSYQLSEIDASLTERTSELDKVNTELSTSDERWQTISGILYGLEYDISDRQQIADALSAQLIMFDRELHTAEERRVELMRMADEGTGKLEILETEIIARSSELEEIVIQVKVAASDKQEIEVEVQNLQAETLGLRRDIEQVMDAQLEQQRSLRESVRIQEQREAELREELFAAENQLEDRTAALLECEAALIQRQETIDRSIQEIDASEMRRQQQTKQLINLQADLQNLTEEVSHLFAGQRKQAKQLEESLNQLKAEISEQVSARELLKLEVADLTERKESMSRAVELSDQQLKTKTDKIESLTQRIDLAKQHLVTVAEKIGHCQIDQQSSEARTKLLRGQIADLLDEVSPIIERHAAEINDNEKNLLDVTRQISNKLSELENLQEAVNSAEAKRKSSEDLLLELEGDLASKRLIAGKLNNEIELHRQEVKLVDEEIFKLEGQRDALQSQVEGLKDSLETLNINHEATSREAASQRLALSHELKHLSDSVSERDALKIRLDLEVRDVREQLRSADTRLDDLRVEIDTKQLELAELSDQNAKRLAEHQDISKKLSETEKTERAQLESLVSQVATNHLQLEDSQGALRTLELQNAEKLRYAEALDAEITAANRNLEALTSEHEERLSEIASLDERAGEIEGQIAEQKIMLADLSSDLALETERLVSIRSQADDETEQFQSQYADLLVQRRQQLDEIEVLNGEVALTKDELLELRTSRDELSQRISGLEDQMQNSNQEHASLLEAIEERQRILAVLEIRAAEKEEAAEEAEQKVIDAKLAYEDAECRTAQLIEDAGKYESVILELQLKIDALESDRSRSESLLSKLANEHEGIEDTKSKAVKECETLEGRLGILRNEVIEADQLANQWKSYLVELGQTKEKAAQQRLTLNEEIEMLQTSSEAKRRDLEVTNSTYEAACEDRAGIVVALDSDVQLLKERIEELTAAKEIAERTDAELRESLDAKKAELATVDASLSELKARKSELEKQASAASKRASNAEDAVRVAESNLGRVEGLVSELKEEKPVVNEVIDNRIVEPREEGESRDAWDDVLS